MFLVYWHAHQRSALRLAHEGRHVQIVVAIIIAALGWARQTVVITTLLAGETVRIGEQTGRFWAALLGRALWGVALPLLAGTRLVGVARGVIILYRLGRTRLCRSRGDGLCGRALAIVKKGPWLALFLLLSLIHI